MRMPVRIKHYWRAVKPGIVGGNLISAAAGFLLASQGHIEGVALPATLWGISLVVASGGLFNNWIDRKIDRKMRRTRDRPLARGLISPQAAITFGTILGLAGLTLVWAAANRLAVLIVLAGWVIYVVVYSRYLKRHSAYSALVGSLAGASPPLAGYCAVTGRVDLGGLILLAIFCLWQMPHCYAIAVLRREDYRAAGIPVLADRKGTAAAQKQMMGYVLAFVGASTLLTFGGYTGYRTLTVAAILGLAWLHLTGWGQKIADERRWAKRLLVFSLVTIFSLSVMMSMDFIAPAPPEILVSYVP